MIAADMAALPAAISVLESLGAEAKGHAVFEITDPADQQVLNIPEGISVTWLLHQHPDQQSNQQLNTIKRLSFPVGAPNIFVAGELSTIREIKDYFMEQSLMNDHSYISSYWKIGAKDEEHKVAKRALA
ncbi:MAG: SIP domain-containing protein [Cytophagales bacterium]|nr:SIP domain-containing protein [Cytophagales bacterium]